MRTYLFGNGLSLAYNDEHYRLVNLTALVRARLRKVEFLNDKNLFEEVKAVAKALGTPVVDKDDFEQLAGPIDVLAKTLVQLMKLHSIAPDAQSRAALFKVARRVKRLHRQVVGIVLELVAGKLPPGDWEPLHYIADHLFECAERQDSLDVFTLNYDALLDSALLFREASHPTVNLMDEFDGRPISLSVKSKSRDFKMLFHPWRVDPYRPPRPLKLHHLHGAATWVMHDGSVYKASELQQLRNRQVFKAWSSGKVVGLTPLVVLTDQKDRAVERRPFSEAYERLSASVSAVDELVVAGYGFRDNPLNRVLTESLPKGCKVWVVAKGDRQWSRALECLRSSNAGRELVRIPRHLPEALSDIPDCR